MINPIKDIDNVHISEDTDPAQLEKVDLSEEIKRKWRQRAHLTFVDRLRMTWRGQTDVGKVVGVGLDIAETFAPKWAAKIRTQLQYKQDTKMDWIKNRLSEKSTWRGIVAVLTALGVSLSPDQTAAIVTAGVALVGIFEAFFKEPQSKDAKK